MNSFGQGLILRGLRNQNKFLIDQTNTTTKLFHKKKTAQGAIKYQQKYNSYS